MNYTLRWSTADGSESYEARDVSLSFVAHECQYRFGVRVEGPTHQWVTNRLGQDVLLFVGVSGPGWWDRMKARLGRKWR